MTNDTKLLLGIEDNHIKIYPHSVNQNPQTGVMEVNALLSYRPKACPNCGIKNCNHKIIKYGWRSTSFKMPRTCELDVIIKLKRRFFKCKECGSCFLAQTNLVSKNCTFSNNTKLAFLEKLKDRVSLTHIAKELSTTATYVNSILQSTEETVWDNKSLPTVINMDEIKSTKHAKGSMSFVYMDGTTHKF
ncbi:transposase family protein [Paucilactobacillus kaifaensis]|uniref:transposase family protein n=1 Tax=Paucilactobacillus kaifaensis TaxID=2559921 RepID=UPI0010F9E1CD|nr:transposase family protein [Paucilactobacillus kaifaensis]